MMNELAQWYAQGKIKPVIDRTMPMRKLKRPTPTWDLAVSRQLVMVNPAGPGQAAPETL